MCRLRQQFYFYSEGAGVLPIEGLCKRAQEMPQLPSVKAVTAGVVAVLRDRARCILQYVLSVARKPRYLSSHVTVGLSIAAIATVNLAPIVNK